MDSTKHITRKDAFTDRNLFGHFFEPLDTWQAHLVIIMALDGLLLNRKQKRKFCSMTRRKYVRSLADAIKILLLIMGRQSGKSCLTGFLAGYEAYFRDHSRYLKAGRQGVVQVVATDKRQAGIILKYIASMFDDSPVLGNAIVRRTADSLELDNGILIQVSSCSIRSVRGYIGVCVIAEEACFWRSDESAHPDRDVINALMATMATIPTGKCFILSSPAGPSGYVYELFRDHYGKDSPDVLVIQGSTRETNPSIEQSFLDGERARDPESYRSEYEAEFRASKSSAFLPEWIDNALTLPDRPLPRSEHLNWRYYAAFDVSGGMGDAASQSVCHIVPGTDIVIVDFVRTWPAPHTPEDVISEAVQYLREYGCNSISGDAYAAQWVTDAFARHGVNYRRSDVNRSQAYLELVPLMAMGKIEAPNRPSLRKQLGSLIRKPRTGSHDVIDHPAGRHDDEANALALACTRAVQGNKGDFSILTTFEESPFPEPASDVAIQVIDHRTPSPWDFS